MSFEENNYYEVLQVDPTANQVDIDASFRRLARLYHPDRNESTFATTFMQELNVAYSVLRDPQQRLEYDKQLDAYAAYERAMRRRQRGNSLNRLFVIPALIALFIFSFIVLVDPATRIGSRSIRSSNLPGVVSATVVAMPLDESAKANIEIANADASTAGTNSPSSGVVQQTVNTYTDEDSLQASAGALISGAVSNDHAIGKNDESLGGSGDDSKAEPESLDQAIAVRPTAGLVIETATVTVTPPPTSTPIATAALTSQPPATSTSTSTPVSTSTSIFTPTFTPTSTATATLIPTSAATSTPAPTATSAGADSSSSRDMAVEVADRFRGVVSQDTMLYVEPNESSSFAPAYAGSVLQAVARSQDGLWYQLDNGYWIAAAHVSRDGEGATSAPEAAARATETAAAVSSVVTHTPNLNFPWQGVSTRNTNLYSIPGQESAVVAGLFEGTPVIAIGISDDGMWYQLNDGYWLAVEAVSPK